MNVSRFSYFRRFRSATVEFISRRGASFRVPLLPVRVLDDVEQIRMELVDFPGADRMSELRSELRKLLLPVWPRKHRRELWRFDCADLVELIELLIFGDRKPETGKIEQLAGKRKNADAGVIDFEFMTARILAIYPGYTHEAVLNLTFPEFSALMDNSFRIQADTALNVMLPAVAAALNGRESLELLQRRRGGYFLRADGRPEAVSAGATLSPEEEEFLNRKLDRILAGDYTVTGKFTMNPAAYRKKNNTVNSRK